MSRGKIFKTQGWALPLNKGLAQYENHKNDMKYIKTLNIKKN